MMINFQPTVMIMHLLAVPLHPDLFSKTFLLYFRGSSDQFQIWSHYHTDCTLWWKYISISAHLLPYSIPIVSQRLETSVPWQFASGHIDSKSGSLGSTLFLHSMLSFAGACRAGWRNPETENGEIRKQKIRKSQTETALHLDLLHTSTGYFGYFLDQVLEERRLSRCNSITMFELISHLLALLWNSKHYRGQKKYNNMLPTKDMNGDAKLAVQCEVTMKGCRIPGWEFKKFLKSSRKFWKT